MCKLSAQLVITFRLRSMQKRYWGDKVTIVAQDMRLWQAPEEADILVSELLGSFGDNELSPECLDGAQKFLKGENHFFSLPSHTTSHYWSLSLTFFPPSHLIHHLIHLVAGGISIPCKSTSYLSPISTSRLWSELKYQDNSFLGSNNNINIKFFETPYVVKLHNFYEAAPPQRCFEFVHPNALHPKTQQQQQQQQQQQLIVDNNRACSLEFEIKESCTIHGFAGYFDSQLYNQTYISWVVWFVPSVSCKFAVCCCFWRQSLLCGNNVRHLSPHLLCGYVQLVSNLFPTSRAYFWHIWLIM